MKAIREIVEYLEIPQKKLELENTKREILCIEKQMSDLTINHNVAAYAYAIDNIEFLKKYFANFSLEDKKAAQEEINNQEILMSVLEQDPNVQEYIKLLNRIIELKKSFSDYNKTINIDLRTELLDLDLPSIYIYQGFVSNQRDYKLCRHIIIPNTVITFKNPEEIETLISRDKEDLSLRRAKKLYNQVSYHYLEQLTEDYNFDLEGKRLGRVNILKRGR